MQSLARAEIQIGKMRFELIRDSRGGKALVATYKGQDQVLVSGSLWPTPASDLSRATVGREDLCLIVVGSDPSSWASKDSTIMVDGQRFYVQLSPAETPLIFQRVGLLQYVLFSQGSSGSPRTLYEITQDFELAPETAFLLAEFVGSAE